MRKQADDKRAYLWESPNWRSNGKLFPMHLVLDQAKSFKPFATIEQDNEGVFRLFVYPFDTDDIEHRIHTGYYLNLLEAMRDAVQFTRSADMAIECTEPDKEAHRFQYRQEMDEFQHLYKAPEEVKQ